MDITEKVSVATCPYCKTAQTISFVDDEKKINLLNRANRLRMNSEFDKAASIYEQIIAEFPDDAESYWCLCLCDYGIEYVDDPATLKKIPTIHRASFSKLRKNENYERALENADYQATVIYQNEAKEIDRIMGEILSISQNETPYDIFICYKETDNMGDRTLDSVMAQDIYDALTTKGYKVFFSRITLEDKLGMHYEPYIFAALNSAKVMLAVGTDYEHYNAAWVKNEWSRFLKLSANDRTKMLIPCFKDMDPYDMPDEFMGLQAQNMEKIGAMQDLIRGIDKIFGKTNENFVQVNQKSISYSSSIVSYLERAYMFLEDGKWNDANAYAERVLDIEPKNAKAYLVKLMAELYINRPENLELLKSPFDGNENYKKLIRFGDDRIKSQINGYLTAIINRIAEENRRIAEERLEFNKKYQNKSSIYSEIGAKILACGGEHIVGLKSDGTVVATGKNNGGKCNVREWTDIISVACCKSHTVGLKSDGTVIAIGEYGFGGCNVQNWTDIVSVFCWDYSTVGLKSDGTVIATGRDSYRKFELQDWKDIVSVVGNENKTVGLKSDGTVVAKGSLYRDCNVQDWKDIVSIACGIRHTVGLKSDGTVVATGCNDDWECNVQDWKDIVSIACGEYHTVGLKSDGTVVATGRGGCYVQDWKDIVSIACCKDYTVGLKSDGTVVATNYSNVQDWKDIVSVVCGNKYTLGLKSDGTVVVTRERLFGDKYLFDNEYNVRDWKLFNHMGEVVDNMNEAVNNICEVAKVKKNNKISSLKTELNNLNIELSKLGIFSKSRKEKIKAQINILTAELKSLEE